MFPRISRVIIKNYKSIGRASVEMRPLTIFIGPNGAGKSNFIDALEFVKDCIENPVESALRERGGFDAVRRNSISHPTNITVGLKIIIDEEREADYVFSIKSEKNKLFKISSELCTVREDFKEYKYEVKDGQFTKSIQGISPSLIADRLALQIASSIEPYRTVFGFLNSMRFYSIAPQEIRRLKEANTGTFLAKDGSNAAAVLKQIKASSHNGDCDYERICRLLTHVVNDIKEISYKSIGKYETIIFKQDVGSRYPWEFDALSMSDGTLRVLGILLALYQTGKHSLIAIEEPEATVHPAVTELLVQVLKSASENKQIILTTHSPEILDYKEISEDDIRMVESEKNNTIIAPLAESNKCAVRAKLCSLGDLHRIGELKADRLYWDKIKQSKLNLDSEV
ncbi:MAG: chromosome segregation protein SMC [Calditrichaeota bacterium]|nr:chromosome segregation protein SMC [Calditrichota bacterium]